MKILFSIISLLIVYSCISTGKYVPKFTIGDCARFNPEKLKEGQYTEEITFYVVDVGDKYYLTSYFYPEFGTINLSIPIRNFDENWLKIKCSLSDEIQPDYDFGRNE